MGFKLHLMQAMHVRHAPSRCSLILALQISTETFQSFLVAQKSQRHHSPAGTEINTEFQQLSSNVPGPEHCPVIPVARDAVARLQDAIHVLPSNGMVTQSRWVGGMIIASLAKDE